MAYFIMLMLLYSCKLPRTHMLKIYDRVTMNIHTWMHIQPCMIIAFFLSIDTPLNLDRQLCPNILSRLEAVGIPAPTELAKSHDVVSSTNLPIGKQQTWRNFIQVLEEMKLHNLVQKIQECLELVTSDVVMPMITDDASKQIVATDSVSDCALKPLKTIEDLAMDVKGFIIIYDHDICFLSVWAFILMQMSLLH